MWSTSHRVRSPNLETILYTNHGFASNLVVVQYISVTFTVDEKIGYLLFASVFPRNTLNMGASTNPTLPLGFRPSQKKSPDVKGEDRGVAKVLSTPPPQSVFLGGGGVAP